MNQVTQALAEQGTREDASMGTTPRKRVWKYVDQWEPTKGRDAILKGWKERNSGPGSKAILAEHQPSLEDDKKFIEDTEMAVDAPLPLVEPEVLNPSEYPMATSPTSSMSSTGSILETTSSALAIPVKKVTGSKSGPQVLGTLTDSRVANVHTTRGSRRGR
jgi:kinesin family protein 11